MSAFEVVSGVPVVAAPEEIDATNAEALRSVLLMAACQGQRTLVVDMTATRFCDSSGVRTLLAAHIRARAEDGELLLVIPDIARLRAFQIIGVDRMIPRVTSLDQALAQASSRWAWVGLRPVGDLVPGGGPDQRHGPWVGCHPHRRHRMGTFPLRLGRSAG